jgi:hypothetical protein
MKIAQHWYPAGQKPAVNQPVLCFNGVIFIGKWDGERWQSSYYQSNPTSPPPSHWRQLPNYDNKWQDWYAELC